MQYHVKLSQIASSGIVSFETNFGFAFTASFRSHSQKVFRMPPRSSTRERVLILLSPCHAAIYDKTPLLGLGCHVCQAPNIYPEELLDREYPDFGPENLSVLQRLISLNGVDSLEAFLLAQGLADILEELWGSVEDHHRVREILSRPGFDLRSLD